MIGRIRYNRSKYGSDIAGKLCVIGSAVSRRVLVKFPWIKENPPNDTFPLNDITVLPDGQELVCTYPVRIGRDSDPDKEWGPEVSMNIWLKPGDTVNLVLPSVSLPGETTTFKIAVTAITMWGRKRITPRNPTGEEEFSLSLPLLQHFHMMVGDEFLQLHVDKSLHGGNRGAIIWPGGKKEILAELARQEPDDLPDIFLEA